MLDQHISSVWNEMCSNKWIQQSLVSDDQIEEYVYIAVVAYGVAIFTLTCKTVTVEWSGQWIMSSS